MFWQRRGADQSGFDCSTTVAAPAFVDGALEIRRVCPETPDREAGRDVWIFPDPDLHAVLPSAEQRFRVLGNPDPEGFLMSGATDFHRLDAAVLAVSGRHLRE